MSLPYSIFARWPGATGLRQVQVLAAALPSLVAALVFRHTYQKDVSSVFG